MKAFATALLLSASTLAAQSIPREPPYWIIQPYTSWNLAVAAVVEHDGDSKTFAVPTGHYQLPYVVLYRSDRSGGYNGKRRVASSSIAVFDANFGFAQFGAIDDALAALKAAPVEQAPQIITTPTHEYLVFWLKPCGSDPYTERDCSHDPEP